MASKTNATSRIDSELAEAIAREIPDVKKVYNALGTYKG